MSDDDLKRTSIMLPRELYERFQETSKDEYKSTSTMIVEWMNHYVKSREKENFEQIALKNAFTGLSDLLFMIGTGIVKDQELKQIHTELAALMFELINTPDFHKTPEFTTRSRLLDRKVREMAVK